MGKVVLIRGEMSGGMVTIAPGVELRAESVDVVMEVPAPPAGLDVIALIFMEDESALETLQDMLLGEPIACRGLPRGIA